MRTKLIDGRAIASVLRVGITREVSGLKHKYGRPPALGLVMVGDRKDSALYVKTKQAACETTGIGSVNHILKGDVSEETVLEKVEEFNKDPCIDGILVQLPLPVHLDTCKIISSILPSKDVDGLHPCNVGSLSMRHRIPHLVPCTAKGIIEMLDDQKVEIEGKTAVVIGRSDLVGNPVSMLLRKRNATVIHCHSKTSNLSSYVKQADILVAACGHPYLVRGSWIKPGSTVIDVGINFIPDWREESGYRIVGDVCFDEALNVAGSITPVPGGVGPMTIAMLLHNVVAAFKYHIVASHENI